MSLLLYNSLVLIIIVIHIDFIMIEKIIHFIILRHFKLIQKKNSKSITIKIKI